MNADNTLPEAVDVARTMEARLLATSTAEELAELERELADVETTTTEPKAQGTAAFRAQLDAIKRGTTAKE